MGYPHLWKPPSEFGTSQQGGSTETRPAGACWRHGATLGWFYVCSSLHQLGKNLVIAYLILYYIYMYNNYNMCVYVGTQVCRHVGLYVCVCMYMFVCICMFRMFFVRFCMYLYDLYVFVCICTGLCVCIDMYLYVCIYFVVFTSGWEIVGVFDWHTHIMIRRK